VELAGATATGIPTLTEIQECKNVPPCESAAALAITSNATPMA